MFPSPFCFPPVRGAWGPPCRALFCNASFTHVYTHTHTHTHTYSFEYTHPHTHIRFDPFNSLIPFAEGPGHPTSRSFVLCFLHTRALSSASLPSGASLLLLLEELCDAVGRRGGGALAPPVPAVAVPISPQITDHIMLVRWARGRRLFNQSKNAMRSNTIKLTGRLRKIAYQLAYQLHESA